MKILLVAATSFEIAPTINFLENETTRANFFEFEYSGYTIFPLVTGVGSMLTAFNMGRFNRAGEIDIAINLGLAGSFKPEISIGQVLQVQTDIFADLGVEEKDGSFTDVFDLELLDLDQYPFKQGLISNEEALLGNIDGFCKAITVNKVHGNQNSINLVRDKYNPDIESMEGAAFAYASKMMKIRYIQLRAISNIVEPRNKDNWDIELAIDKLNESFVYLLRNSVL